MDKTLVDDAETTAGIWEGWSVKGLDASSVQFATEEYNESEFTKDDFEKVLRKVSRKVKK